MLRMAPLVIVAVDESQENDGNPRIDEYRIEQHVQPGLPFGPNLDEDNHRQDVLAEHDSRHDLRRHEVIDVRIERREGELHIADDDKERRNHQKMRLHEVDALIPHADVLVLPARFEHLRDEAVADIELALCPALALIPGLLERKRLLVIDDGVMRPTRLDALRHALHRELHILRQAGCIPAMLFKDIGGKAHARAAKAGRQANVGFRQMRNVANDPESDRKRACDPGIVRILGIHIALDDLIAFAETVIHLHEELRMHEVIRIEYADRVVLFFHLEQTVKHPLERIALRLLRRMRARMDDCTGICGNLCRVIGAVIRNHMDIIHILRIVEALQILDQLPDDSMLVVRCHNQRKRLLRGLDLRLTTPPHATETDDKEIKREQENHDLHGNHDDIKWEIKQKSSAFLCK